MADSFAVRFGAVRSRYGPLAWGLDPSGAILDAWGLGDTPEGLDRFAEITLEAASGTVGLVKLQAAFYERHGWQGFRTLQRLIGEAQSAGLLVIVDAKRGDVGTTNEAYAEAYLGADAPLGADALTVHPYLGLGAMATFVFPRPRRWKLPARGGSLFQPRRPYGPVRHHSQRSQRRTGPVGDHRGAQRSPGARRDRTDRSRRWSHPCGPGTRPLGGQWDILAPGVGTQGATPSDVAEVFAVCRDRVIPSASRSLLVEGPDVTRLGDAAGALAGEFRRLLTAG